MANKCIVTRWIGGRNEQEDRHSDENLAITPIPSFMTYEGVNKREFHFLPNSNNNLAVLTRGIVNLKNRQVPGGKNDVCCFVQLVG